MINCLRHGKSWPEKMTLTLLLWFWNIAIRSVFTLIWNEIYFKSRWKLIYRSVRLNCNDMPKYGNDSWGKFRRIGGWNSEVWKVVTVAQGFYFNLIYFLLSVKLAHSPTSMSSAVDSARQLRSTVLDIQPTSRILATIQRTRPKKCATSV